jgi:hypothetical protein
VAEFGKRLEAAKQRSRFGFVRSNKRAYAAPVGFVAGAAESDEWDDPWLRLGVNTERRARGRTIAAQFGMLTRRCEPRC